MEHMEIDVNREGEGQFAKDVVCENFSENLLTLHTNTFVFSVSVSGRSKRINSRCDGCAL